MKRFGRIWTLGLAALLSMAILAMPSNAEAKDHKRSKKRSSLSVVLNFGGDRYCRDRVVYVEPYYSRRDRYDRYDRYDRDDRDDRYHAYNRYHDDDCSCHRSHRTYRPTRVYYDDDRYRRGSDLTITARIRL